MPSVLVLDADQPSTLAIVRSLGRRGLEVHVASAEIDPLCRHSRFAATHFCYPDPLTDEPGFIEGLLRHVGSHPYALIVPVTERSVVPLMRHRDRFDPAVLAVAPTEALEQALDKNRTLALADALGIPVPRSQLVSNVDELIASAKAFSFPIVVKPARSFGADEARRVQLTVSYAHDQGELERLVGSALRYGPVILQEYFQGEGVGIELIADHGELKYVFQHRRLHEVPLTGGGSSLRIAEAPVPSLRAAASALMKALGWHGVAMVEFKYDPRSGAFRLIEINGRFWGSLPLAVAAGADFPAMLYQLMSTGRVEPCAPAREGTVCRQLSRDFDWLEHVLRKAAPPGLARLPTRGEIMRDTLLIFSARHHFDVQSWRDPKPGLVDLRRIALRQWRRVAGHWAARLRLRRERQSAQMAGVAQLAAAKCVLFLCYGNINRSALAHVYAQRAFASRYEFISAGFHYAEGRPADSTMVEVAKQSKLDLSQWHSQSLTPEMVRRADVILAMEVAHLERLQRDHPAAAGKAFLLGALPVDGKQTEVPDPFGQPHGVYIGVADQIRIAVDAWFKTAARRD